MQINTLFMWLKMLSWSTWSQHVCFTLPAVKLSSLCFSNSLLCHSKSQLVSFWHPFASSLLNEYLQCSAWVSLTLWKLNIKTPQFRVKVQNHQNYPLKTTEWLLTLMFVWNDNFCGCGTYIEITSGRNRLCGLCCSSGKLWPTPANFGSTHCLIKNLK